MYEVQSRGSRQANYGGPDQVLPAVNNWTSSPEGCVQLRLTETGPSSKKPISIYSYFKRAVDKFKDRQALLIKRGGKWQTWTYSEYFKESCLVAKAFIKLGLEQFYGVCILGHNNPEWMISNYGAVFAGGLSAGIYTTNSPEACFSVADNCRAQIIVVEDETFLRKFLSVKHLLPNIKAIIQWTGEPGALGVLSWPELMAIGDHESDDLLNQRLSMAAVNQCCALIYTSGTTAAPKGVMLSQDQITWVCLNAAQAVDWEEIRISYLPLSHVASQMGDMYNTLAIGATIYIAPPDALKGNLSQFILEVRPTFLAGVPRIWEKFYEKLQETLSNASFFKRSLIDWAKVQGLNYYDALREGRLLSWLEVVKYSAAKRLVFNKLKRSIGLDRVQFLLTSAAPISAEILNFFLSLDLPIIEAYGLSESMGAGSVNLISPGQYKFGSVGKVVDFVEVSVRPLDGADGTGDQEGEICFRGRNVFMGYLRMPEETNRVIDVDGWLRTGDLGHLDDDGFLRITGRLKELVITSGGENVTPTRIEAIIKKEIPAISNAMLVGDRRKYLTILLTFKSEMKPETGEPLQQLTSVCQEWLRGNGSEAKTVNEALEEMRVQPHGPLARAIQRGIDRYNEDHAYSNPQQIRGWSFLPHDFSLPTGELSNTLKLRRPIVMNKYFDIIDAMYSREEKIPSKL